MAIGLADSTVWDLAAHRTMDGQVECLEAWIIARKAVPCAWVAAPAERASVWEAA